MPRSPLSLAEDIVAAMPNAQLELIPAGGHRPDIRTPELVNPLLLDFLVDGNPPGRQGSRP